MFLYMLVRSPQCSLSLLLFFVFKINMTFGLVLLTYHSELKKNNVLSPQKSCEKQQYQ